MNTEKSQIMEKMWKIQYNDDYKIEKKNYILWIL